MTDQIKEFRRVVKFETFLGVNFRGDSASDKANEWLKKNPNVRIIDFKYSANCEKHLTHDSICIMYETEEEVLIDL